ncbi:MAG: class I SAM-dependent methyltransferase [Euryarchaeota archaeon]|nr:class I SAM-dependent methyltransferase [Euryarchaeota archaeon]
MRIRTFFDGRAKYYEKIFSLPMIKRLEQAEVRKIVSLSEVAGKSVLDIGCGCGKFLKLWRDRGASTVVGMDFSKSMLGQAKQKSNFLLMGDAFKIPFKDNSFDFVACIGVANYYRNVEALLKEISRVSRNGIIITFPKNSLIGKIYARVSKIPIFLREEWEIKNICSPYFELLIKECASGLTFVVTSEVREKDSTARLQRSE